MPHSFASCLLHISIFRIAVLLRGFCFFLSVFGFFLINWFTVFFDRSWLMYSPQCRGTEVLVWSGKNYSVLTLLDLRCPCDSAVTPVVLGYLSWGMSRQKGGG